MAAPGTIIFTGANSSLGFHAVEHILKKYGTYTAVLTVRDASSNDKNTNKLRNILLQYPNVSASIHEVDLANLSSVRTFADTITAGVDSQKHPPIASIVCNAYYWNLVADSEITLDGFDKTFQVNHIAHAALLLRLLGSFGKTAGRIIHISSDSHWPGKNGMDVYPPSIPDDLSLLLSPPTDEDKNGRGYQRYATSKLVLTTWVHALNSHLQKVWPSLSCCLFRLVCTVQKQ